MTGERVEVVYLAARVPGRIEDVSADGRALIVECADGERVHFALNRATGQFAEAGDATGARLVFPAD